MKSHILLYTDDPGVGGVAQYNHSILLELKKQGYRVTSVQGKTANPLVEHQREQGIQHEWLDFDTIQNFHRTFYEAADAERVFSLAQPDLILFSDGCPVSNFAAKQVALDLGIPYLIVVGFVSAEMAERFVFCLETVAQHYAQAKAVIAVSQENLELLHQRYGLPANKGEVIYYGRPEPYFAPQRQEVRDRLRQETGVPADGIVCFTAARLEGLKGYQYQLDAIVQLQQMPVWSHLYFVWAGSGQLQEQLVAALHALEVNDRVTLLGHRWDLADWFDAADLFVFPSEAEGMPLAVMEAMAKGLPVVASAVSGIPEELGNTGKLLPDPKIDPQATVGELVATIQTWADDAALRRAIGQAGQQRAKVMFVESRMIRETMTVIERALLRGGDYVSPGLTIIQPDAAFPNMVVGDPNACAWPYLRRQVAHNWYVDQRNPVVGFLSRDEAHILYNTALQFTGKKALEIGCWLGWSACHLALAGVELDVVDPLLARSEFYQSVSDSLQAAGVRDAVTLISGYSPQAIADLTTQHPRKWSLIFIDGNHDAPGPLEDAIACEPLAEPDAMIVFHDLASPEVAEGLDYLKQQGWQTLIYQTMQIMGVAWRGNVQPIAHQPDPQIQWELPAHLQHYTVSGMPTDPKAAIPQTAIPQTAIPQTAVPQQVEGGLLPQILRCVDQVPPYHHQPLAADLDQTQLGQWLQQGQTAYVCGDWSQAILAFSKALELNPGSAIAHHHLSTLYWHQGNVQTSLNHQVLVQSGNRIVDSMRGEEFQSLVAAIAPFTLLSLERLFSLYSLAKQVCLDDIPGHFVECGTYKGGSAALLAAVIQRYSRRSRRVYAFDTFAGMPEPTAADRHQGIPANETPWGAGTLQAPLTENLQVVCQQLGVSDRVVAVPGLFAQTLPQTRSAIGDIAFLHADGDWYESTLDIFNNLYSSVVPEGYIQVDDYGHWEGCRQAIHEFERQQHESFALQKIDITGVWFRKRDPADPDCNYWRMIWQLAQTAERLGDRQLAQTAASAVLQIVPQLIPALSLLERLQDVSPPVEEAIAPLPTETLPQELRLRAINLIVFPDWHQPEEILFSNVIDLLKPLLPHPERSRITLLIYVGTAVEQADLTLADAVMHLLTEENLEVSEAGPEISPIYALTPTQWQALIPTLAARIVLEHDDQKAIAIPGMAQLPAYPLHAWHDLASGLNQWADPPQHSGFSRGDQPPDQQQATYEQVQKMMEEALKLLKMDKPAEALELAEQAASMGINVPKMHYLRCLCFCAVGRAKEGLEAARAELTIDPNDSHALDAIQVLTHGVEQVTFTDIPTSDRSWGTALPHETLHSIQQGTHSYTYQGVPLLKNPFDLALYPLLIWQVQPRTIIEIGSNRGGSALWLGDILNNYGIDGHVYSLDIVQVTDVSHPRVTFSKANGRDLGRTLTPDFLNALPRPLLVIEDADHNYQTTRAVLEFFHPYLRVGEYIVIEDGIISDINYDSSYSSGPHLGLKEFFANHADEYEVDSRYCDFFGYNITWNTNGYLKKVERKSCQEPSAAAIATLFQDLVLRQVNLIVCPDWSQPDEIVFADLVTCLRVVLPHWDRHQITLLIQVDFTNADQADLVLSGVIMHLLIEENIETSEEGPAIAPLRSFTPTHWQALIPHLTARIVLEHEDQRAIATSSIDQIPAYTPDTIASTAWH